MKNEEFPKLATAKYFLHIITDSCTQEAALALNTYLHTLTNITDIYAEPIKPYWKQPEQGELVCSFNSPHPIGEIQAVLADHWEGDVADARWSRIHVPHAVFIWLST